MRTAFSLLLIAASLAAAGCGGGAKKAVDSAATAGKPADRAPGASTIQQSSGASSQDDCQMLDSVVFDLGGFASTGTGFDYVGDRDFLDGYAGRAPGGIAASVRRIRDLVDRFASAAQDAGVGVNQDPSEEQLQKMQGKLHYSNDEQAQNDAALSQLSVYAGTATSC